MKFSLIIYFLLLTLFFSCSKEEEVTPQEPVKPIFWKKYIGDYMVYDTLGNYMYDMSISHYTGISTTSGNELDSMLIQNFADTFDLTFQFITNYTDLTLSQEFLNIQFHDSLTDYNNKMWWIGSALFDTTTTVNENSLINDTMIMYFVMDNIKFYINEAQPYFMVRV